MKRHTTGVSFSPELLAWLRRKAECNGLSLSGFVNMALLKVKREEDAADRLVG